MASLNRVFLVGNLTRDPELRYISTGTAVTDLGLAVNDRRKNANGEWVEETTFVTVTLWGRQAETASEYLTKGAPVLIEGRLKFDSWEADGQKRSKLSVVGERMQMLGRRGDSHGEGGPPAGARPAGRPTPQRNAPYNHAAPPDDGFDAPPPEAMDTGSAGGGGGGDDIPF
jgi:single-strand DNA-binding protein